MVLEKKRIEFIDLAKGVCILLVVMLHCGGPAKIPGYEIVRMPLYFILSGLFFKDYGGVRNLILKKVNKLIIPFCFFYIVSYILYFLTAGLINYFFPGKIDMSYSIFDIFVKKTMLNNPIWFLLALFWCNIIFCIVNQFIRNNILKIATIILLATSGCLLGKEHIFVTLYIDVALSALPFFCTGYYLRKTTILVKNKYDKFNLLIALCLWGISYISYEYFNPVLEFYCNTVSGVSAYFIAFCSVLSILFLCKAIGKIPFVSYVGHYSIVILCVHMIFIFYTYRILKLFSSQLYTYWFVNMIIVMLFSTLCIPIFKKYIPKFIAQKDVIILNDNKCS